MNHEEIRRRFLPTETRLLFVGESPPAGGTFFYVGDSGLLRYTSDAFSSVYACPKKPPSEFLAFFQQLGCFLDDLCHYPIDRLNRTERRAAQRREVDTLAARISDLRPQSIACFVRGIEPLVRKAIASAGYDRVPFSSLPFPGMSHQARYVSGLSAFLSQLAACGVLPPGRAA